MRTWLIWIAAFFIFAQFYVMVEQKESLRRNGQEMFLKLAPVDPRSLMQGDYMDLNYALTVKLFDMQSTSANANPATSGTIVVRLDDHQVADFARLDDGKPLAPNEHLLRYRRDQIVFTFGVERYFIPEGTGDAFKDAVYGDIRVSPAGEAVLVGLRDKDFHPLGVPAN